MVIDMGGSISIGEIKNRLKTISDCGIMEYDSEIKALEDFIREYESDSRSGVMSTVKSASKKLDSLKKEILRVQDMSRFEKENASKYKYICGVDEVGRGPLAGPIVTAAVILPNDTLIPYLNDSKQLSEKRREELFDIINEVAVSVSIGIRSEKEIDDNGIAVMDSAAMRDSVLGLEPKADLVLVDAFKIPNLDIPQIPIIKGDTLSVSIAAASIVAKVTRDRMMDEYASIYPEYGFDSNKGYGSAKHIEAIKTIGPCDIHRRSFIKNFV